MKRLCVTCGTPLDINRRSDARYCGDLCRQRAHRYGGPKSTSRTLPPAPRSPSPVPTLEALNHPDSATYAGTVDALIVRNAEAMDDERTRPADLARLAGVLLNLSRERNELAAAAADAE